MAFLSAEDAGQKSSRTRIFAQAAENPFQVRKKMGNEKKSLLLANILGRAHSGPNCRNMRKTACSLKMRLDGVNAVKNNTQGLPVQKWSLGQDLNLRPIPYKGNAPPG
jgi:hypothetical protein